MRASASTLGLAISLSLLVLAGSAAAGGIFGVQSASVQTRDGSPWSDGQPIVLVVRATSSGMSFPAQALAVVMQTDGERTKCLDVAMTLVSTDSGVATYAGVFHPFRAATYDGRFSIGEDVHDIRFTVGTAMAAAAAIPAEADLPVLPLVTFDYEPAIDARAVAAIGAAALAGVALVARGLRRRPRFAPAG
jgi:hypothetical protein